MGRSWVRVPPGLPNTFYGGKMTDTFSAAGKKSPAVELSKNELIQSVHVHEFDDATVKALASAITDATMKKQPFLPIYIESYGGSVYPLLAMISHIKNAPIEIHTIVCGRAMSAGAMLFCFGDRRFIASDAYLMFHDVSSWNVGTITRLESGLKHTKILGRHIRGEAAIALKKDKKFFADMIKNAVDTDVFMSAKEVLKSGIATEIDIPMYMAQPKIIFHMSTKKSRAEHTKEMKEEAKKAKASTKKAAKKTVKKSTKKRISVKQSTRS